MPSPCRPRRSPFAGPFTSPTANPVLVVGNLFDPATPYHGAQVVNGLLPNSVLLTVQGWGHTSIGLSQCAAAPGLNQLLLPDMLRRGGP